MDCRIQYVDSRAGKGTRIGKEVIMAGKQFELLFQLTATLGPNFSQSFKNASKTMAALQSDLRNADSKLKDVSAYQKQQQAVAKSKERVSVLMHVY